MREIVEIRPRRGEAVLIKDNGREVQYYRYAPDVWEVVIGDSTEQHYFCEEVETLYQQYKQSQQVQDELA